MTTYIIVFLAGLQVGQWLLLHYTAKLLTAALLPEE